MSDNIPPQIDVLERSYGDGAVLEVTMNGSERPIHLDTPGAVDLAEKLLESVTVDPPRLETGLWLDDERGRLHASIDFDGYRHTTACDVTLEEWGDVYGVTEADPVPEVTHSRICRECLLEAPTEVDR